MTAVQLQADKRFRRARAQPARRRSLAVSARTARLLLACAVIAVAVHQGPQLLSGSDLLRVEHVTIKGNRYLSQGEVLALLDRMHGENILEIDLEAHRRLLLTSGWVRGATLRRLLPSTIEVTVTERQPVGLVRLETQLYLVDATGTLIDEYRPQFADLRLPVIDGLQMRNARGFSGGSGALATRGAPDGRPRRAARPVRTRVPDRRDRCVGRRRAAER